MLQAGGVATACRATGEPDLQYAPGEGKWDSLMVAKCVDAL